MTHVQGPVPVANESYVERPFEQTVQRELMNDQWVLLLGPRQHGKTSALVRVKKALIELGVEVAFVDLQDAPPFDSYPELVDWFCGRVGRELGLVENAAPEQAETPKGFMGRLLNLGDPAARPPQQSSQGSENLLAQLDELIPEGKSPVIVLIDEASNISNPAFRNAFFGQLRSISSRRADAGDNELSKRLRFLFAGTFRYETLIDEKNSPFNVCEHVYTEDLTLDDVSKLVEISLGKDELDLANKIFEEVGGQPFLVQKFLSRMEQGEDPSQILDQEIVKMRAGDSSHVEHLFGKVMAETELASIVSLMVKDGAAPNEAANSSYRYLQVLGIATRDGQTLKFRNSLYENIARTSPQLGGTESQGNQLVPMFPRTLGAFAKVSDPELREIAWSAHCGAIAAYKAHSNRMALAGFGSSLEAMLLDLMLRQQAGTPAQIGQQAGCNFGGQNANDPKTWSLYNLILAASKVGGTNAIEPPQALRKWRNSIHPSVAIQDYRPDIDLDPEVRTAAGLHEIILRDLP